MSGNVWKWCQDCKRFLQLFLTGKSTCANSGSYRVLRWGGRLDAARICRSSYRSGRSPDYRYDGLGASPGPLRVTTSCF